MRGPQANPPWWFSVHLFSFDGRANRARYIWQWLLGFVPLLNLYIWFLLVFQPGTHGANRYGADPLA